MDRYAIVEDEQVVNVVVWNGDESIWGPPKGCTAVPVPDGASVQIGDTYTNGEFGTPNATSTESAISN